MSTQEVHSTGQNHKEIKSSVPKSELSSIMVGTLTKIIQKILSAERSRLVGAALKNVFLNEFPHLEQQQLQMKARRSLQCYQLLS